MKVNSRFLDGYEASLFALLCLVLTAVSGCASPDNPDEIDEAVSWRNSRLRCKNGRCRDGGSGDLATSPRDLATTQPADMAMESPPDLSAPATHDLATPSAPRDMAMARPDLATPTTPPPSSGPTLAGCPIFPADNAWNKDISGAAVHPNSSAYVASIGASTAFHPDWSSTAQNAPYGYGIPFTVVPAGQAKVPISFVSYPSESDPGPYPIPSNIPIENGGISGDRHGIVLDSGTCYLYEVFELAKSGSGWQGACGAIWHLKENWTRPKYWTSVDAAGLAVFPGLVRYDEVAAGEIKHALRFTVSRSQRAFIAPASHYASSSTDSSLPPMGLRMRLKASVDETKFPTRMRVIIRALKRYGMFVADNGSNWFVQGAPDSRWDDNEIATLKQLHGSDFEAVQTGAIQY